MEPLFTTYEEYKQYVNEEWNAGAINELEADSYIIPEFIDKDSDSVDNVHYRKLTEDEFNSKFKQNQ